MVKSGVRWLHRLGCNVMAMSPGRKDYGHHNYPLERIEKAIAYLKAVENEKIGIVGASTTGMAALVSASLFPEITLTIAITPPDFVMEGFSGTAKTVQRSAPPKPGGALCCGYFAERSFNCYFTPIHPAMTIRCTSEVPS